VTAASGAPTLGVDLGGTNLRIGVVDATGAILAEVREPAPSQIDALVQAIGSHADQLIPAHGISAVGVGTAGMIDADGAVRYAPNLPMFVDVPLRSLLAERIAKPLMVENDANAAAWGEYSHGAARGTRHALVITLGTGVGGGVIIDGRIFRGASGTGAELGHMVVQADGPPCQRNCPNRGCLETMVSGTAIARDAGMHAEEVVRLATAGDAAAIEVLTRAGRYLGVGLASLANIFNPDAFVIGGGAAAAGEFMLAPARAEYRARALPPNAQADVLPAALGATAGAIGAAIIAWDLVDRDG
jgi:glucokinase